MRTQRVWAGPSQGAGARGRRRRWGRGRCGREVRKRDCVGVVGDSSPGFDGPAGGSGVAHAACWVAVQEADGGEGPASSPRPQREGGELPERAEGAGETPVISAPSVAAGLMPGTKNSVARPDGTAAAKRRRRVRPLASGAADRSAVAASNDGVGAQNGGVGAGLPASRPERGASVAGKLGAVGGEGGP